MLCDNQCTGQSETTFNLKLNYRKDVNKQHWLQADQHFRLPSHDFNKHTIFTLIEKLNDTSIDKELLKYTLKNEKTSGLKN